MGSPKGWGTGFVPIKEPQVPEALPPPPSPPKIMGESLIKWIVAKGVMHDRMNFREWGRIKKKIFKILIFKNFLKILISLSHKDINLPKYGPI